MRSFSEPRAQGQSHSDQITQIIRLINKAERPVSFGGGVRSAGEAGNLQHSGGYRHTLSLTWAVMDSCSSKDPLNVGGFGVTSARSGNFAVQNSDLIVCFGTRLTLMKQVLITPLLLERQKKLSSTLILQSRRSTRTGVWKLTCWLRRMSERSCENL